MKTKTTRISLLTLLIVGSFMLPLILAETNESLENNSESLILANENTNQEINSLNEEELGLKEDVLIWQLLGNGLNYGLLLIKKKN
jgi:hypothetical protein